MNTTRIDRPEDEALIPDERPSQARVEGFLHGIERKQQAASRTRWVGLGVGTVIAAVAYLTSVGLMPVEAEGLVISASALVAGLAIGKA
jgi:hypothetical protein